MNGISETIHNDHDSPWLWYLGAGIAANYYAPQTQDWPYAQVRTTHKVKSK